MASLRESLTNIKKRTAAVMLMNRRPLKRLARLFKEDGSDDDVHINVNEAIEQEPSKDTSVTEPSPVVVCTDESTHCPMKL
jgi:hypothetical protein